MYTITGSLTKQTCQWCSSLKYMKKEQKIINKFERLLKKIKPPKRPFGMFVSGGIDSALLAALLKPDVIFTARFPFGPKYDEYEYTLATVKHLGLEKRLQTTIVR